MFAEDLSPFFDAASGFAITATWKRDGGDVAGSVLFDEETREVFDDAAIADAREIRYPRNGAFAEIGEGDIVEINGTRYKLRPPRLEGDGAVLVAVLLKMR